MSLTNEDVLRRWHEARLAPLWESPNAHKEAAPPIPAHIWRWEEMRPLIELAFQEQSPAAVQRRVLQMWSPASQSLADEFTCGNVLAAYQCLLPGETARPHRHPMNALRFMLEGSGVITLVDRKECPMEFGDLVLTPGMTWHEHRHDGKVPVVWLDVLDVPLHLKIGTAMFEPGPIHDNPVTMPDACFASPNILPAVTYGRADHSPVFRYPYADAVRALQAAPESPDGARRIRYVNPLNGASAMAVLESTMMQIDGGVTTKPMRTNASLVCAVVEGEGESRIGDQTLRWKQRDVFTIPQRAWASHTAFGAGARIYIVSDADMLRRLGLLQEEIQENAA
ncbi:cupin domain-containing protein [Caldimonas thermodepolymerans]|jgi:Gentisate 1,2-dioxygenase|uniref:Cupin n=1 Tax=Caldimonas thermodepolymerans TaxID=215580 RepID=A0A2S5T0G3_9BURK|nr:cupin domain-containing protein [Caldimonas thermodepolymerans]PPE68525.1 cupin [Caldimonas thermodepolymerans]QPC31499.1 cupin domain-containing protein [Caldimonas thermodepolymerans]RDH99521.1 gentisate 1,2-dioxygenase [Caldimonas thermodepolymerans]TCP07752.1 gentisate 1,2-dioxygenase [Caldimonas thermodepolymerans]UZG44251.1 cupin domain-containing protein [Caldimonas thermodepolymerans]